MGDSNDKKMFKSEQTKICTLPDAVLHHILSFLDMKDVLATSLLSTRWGYLWVSVPVLNFSDTLWIKELNNLNQQRKFINFADRVLLLRDGSDINKFEITLSSYYYSGRLDVWLAVAARRKFQEIHLKLCVKQTMDLPYLLFSSSITVLKLEGEKSRLDYNPTPVPKEVCLLPLLKTLVLCYVKLPDGNSDGVLVFSNPVLENLTLIDFKQSHLKVLNISACRLKNMVYENYNFDFVDSCINEICCPNLESIHMGGCWYYHCDLGNLSCLVRAKFNFVHLPMNAGYLASILEGVSCQTTIKLYGDLEFVDEEWPFELTQQYTNVKCLKFHGWGGREDDSLKSDCYLLNLLNVFPCLEALHLQVYDTYELEELEEEWLLPITFYHLKYVKIERLRVWGNELRFLKFLLKNAINLEKLVIEMDTSLSCYKTNQSDLQIKHDFGDKLHSLARASPRLILLLL